MAQQDEPLGDVINISSSEDDEPSNKRSLQDSDSSEAESTDDESSRQRKRQKTASAAQSSAGTPSTGAEEGEIEDDSTMEQTRLGKAGDSGSSCVFLPEQPPVFKATLDGDGTAVDFKLPVFSQQRHGNWEERFGDWAKAFCVANVAEADAISTSILTGGYNFYLEQSSGIKPKKKKSAKLASEALANDGRLKALIVHECARAKAALSQQTDDDDYEPPMEISAPEVPSQNQNGTGHDAQNGAQNGERPVMSEEEIAIVRKYFPGAKDPTNMCHYCAQEGHTSAICPNNHCKFCLSPDHGTYTCPTRRRCVKCRQMGHQKEDCTEKLALTTDEGLVCGYCGEPDHLEDHCSLVYRTNFPPDPATITKVRNITPSCSLCASREHYSSDCAKHPPGLPKNPIWTMKYRNLFVDPNSDVLSIVEESALAEAAAAADVKIRGRAAKSNNVVHYSSDDSDTEFLGKKPVQKRAPLGSIRMASNIQMPSGAMDGQPQQGGRGANGGQPPLPPGLPPRLDSSSSTGRRQPPTGPSRGNPSSLPSKPPPSNGSRDYRSVPPPPANQSSRNSSRGGGNRGGNRGGGGGRGRGRGGGGGGGRGGNRGRGRWH